MAPPLRSTTRQRVLAVLAAGATAASSAALLDPGTSTASSHREAPYTLSDPLADNTDTYAFVSPDNPDTANLSPFAAIRCTPRSTASRSVFRPSRPNRHSSRFHEPATRSSPTNRRSPTVPSSWCVVVAVPSAKYLTAPSQPPTPAA